MPPGPAASCASVLWRVPRLINHPSVPVGTGRHSGCSMLMFCSSGMTSISATPRRARAVRAVGISPSAGLDVAGTDADGSPIAGHLGHQGLRIVRAEQHGMMLRFNELLSPGMLKKRAQQVVIAVNVQQRTGFAVQAKGRSRSAFQTAPPEFRGLPAGPMNPSASSAICAFR